MFDTTEQHEVYCAGEEPLSGIGLTTMESLLKVQHVWKHIKKLHAHMNRVSDVCMGAEITDWAVCMPDSLICPCKCLILWDMHELWHYIKSTSSCLSSINLKDGTA